MVRIEASRLRDKLRSYYASEGARDLIRIDVPTKSLDLLVDTAELANRMDGWQPNPPRYTTGVLGKYAKLVQGAETGAITNTL